MQLPPKHNAMLLECTAQPLTETMHGNDGSSGHIQLDLLYTVATSYTYEYTIHKADVQPNIFFIGYTCNLSRNKIVSVCFFQVCVM